MIFETLTTLDLAALPQEAAVNEEGYLSILLRSIFVENILLAFFLGMCSYLAVSKRVDSALGLGVAVIFVLGLTVPINWCVQTFILAPGALEWAGMPDSDLSYLQFLTFIASIAAAVQIVEMAVDKMSPKLYAALGIFLPLIAVNCAILGSVAVHGRAQLHARPVDGVRASAPASAGCWRSCRWPRSAGSCAPRTSRRRSSGLGITFITTGLIAMAFMTFSGIQL